MAVFQVTTEIQGFQRTLRTWLNHFDRVGVPAGMIESDGYLSIWRAGERAGIVAKTDKPKGLLKDAVNGFERHWLEVGGVIANEVEKGR